MLNRETPPGTRVRVIKSHEALEDKLAVTKPLYHDVLTALHHEGLLKPILKLDAVFTVDYMEDHDIPLVGFAVRLKEVEGLFPAETFEVVG